MVPLVGRYGGLTQLIIKMVFHGSFFFKENFTLIIFASENRQFYLREIKKENWHHAFVSGFMNYRT